MFTKNDDKTKGCYVCMCLLCGYLYNRFDKILEYYTDSYIYI